MFETMYKSSWHHPGAAWCVGGLMLLWVIWRLPFFWGFIVGALALTAVDAGVTGAWSQAGGEAHALYAPLTFFFVLFGDWRTYLLAHRYSSKPDASPASWWLGSFAFAMFPMIAIGLMRYVLFVEQFKNMRILFAVYELIVIGVLMTYLVIVLPRRLAHVPDEVARWLKLVVGFSLTHYILWISSDALIMNGLEWGYGLRMMPNVMYYALFIPFVYMSAPRAIKKELFT